MVTNKCLKHAVSKTAISAAMLAMTSMTTFAANPVEIKSISLEIVSNIEEKDSASDVDIKTSSKDFDITDYYVTNEPDDMWVDGDKPKLKIKIETDDDDAFFSSSLDKDDIKIELKSPNTENKTATVTKVSRSGKTKAYIYVTLPAVGDGEYDLSIPEIYWEEDSAYAYWEPAEDAKSYELKLYRDDKLVNSKSITTTEDGYDFSEHFTKAGDYKYKIRAVYNKSHKGEWEESDEIDISKDEVYNPTLGQPSGANKEYKDGTWVIDSNGWWWLNTDRTWPSNQWKKINNKWYYFNENGYMHKGWVFTDGNWYHCSDNGDRDINKVVNGCKVDGNGAWVGTPNTWFKWGSDWYYFNNNGKPALNQWVLTNDVWYYLGYNGVMLTNTTTPDGYKVDANGAWIQ